MSMTTVSLLELLKREDNALMREREYGENIIECRGRQERCGADDPDIRKRTTWNFYQKNINRYIEQRDKAVADLLEVRREIKLYFENL